jgi:hypothetical protein
MRTGRPEKKEEKGRVGVIMDVVLIAPCAMNCNICRGHLYRRNPCGGCAANDIGKPVACKGCTVTICEKRKASRSGFCYECENYPCRRIKDLDKRYRSKYNMSMIENLVFIRENGMEQFLDKEVKKWTCTRCGAVISCHIGFCMNCGTGGRAKISTVNPPK